jgi:RNA polymerase sigma factor (sigma-70 family)
LLSDTQLARAAQSGDAASLGVLLERHRAPLYALALRFLGYNPDAQEAVQDAFLTALRTIDRLREPEAVGGWLRGIQRNVCLRRLRERQGEKHFERPEHEIELTFLESSVEEAIEHLTTREWVWSALGRLPENLQLTVALRYFSGHSSYEEISAVLGVPMGTVKSRLNTAKLMLAGALLETASLEQDETRRITQARANFFETAYAEYNQAKGYEILASAFSGDLVFSAVSNGKVLTRDHEFLVGDMERDLELGVKLHPTEVVSSKSVAVIEFDIESPPGNPRGCPPTFSQVAFYRDEKIHRLHWHLPPRPVGESRWENNLPAAG